ncbi:MULTISPECIES: hypothetical protein [unclassified Nostoc]|uniref:hypothetical protein n=1 Tax=unclassified Nostoc TaxID=2593658 RepID=UPI00162AD8F9|nr:MULTISPECIES: hypothetical protein [unclassified Nostoc]MBC1224497.1 hypothetical protein [Nostoc sp. UCD120]
MIFESIASVSRKYFLNRYLRCESLLVDTRQPITTCVGLLHPKCCLDTPVSWVEALRNPTF